MYFASQRACCPAAFIWPELPPPESPHCVAQATAARAADARAADDRAAIKMRFGCRSLTRCVSAGSSIFASGALLPSPHIMGRRGAALLGCGKVRSRCRASNSCLIRPILYVLLTGCGASIRGRRYLYVPLCTSMYLVVGAAPEAASHEFPPRLVFHITSSPHTSYHILYYTHLQIPQSYFRGLG